MSRPSAKKQRTRSEKSKQTPDSTIYIAVLVIVAFVLLLGALFTDGVYVKHILAICAGIFAVMVNYAAWLAYKGKHDMSGMQKALARLPLRCAGYGSKGGKPVEAAHDQPQARSMITASVVVSIVAVAALAAWALLT
jgi:hypothetical protein